MELIKKNEELQKIKAEISKLEPNIRDSLAVFGKPSPNIASIEEKFNTMLKEKEAAHKERYDLLTLELN